MSTQRTITVFTTKGKQKVKITTDVATWGDLKPLVSQEGYDLSSLAATENVGRTTLEHKDATLPTGDFVLFLRPVKTKSGLTGMEELSFKELRARIKEEGDDCKAFLSNFQPGTNWTRLSTGTLREALIAYTPKGKTKKATKVVESAPVVEEVTETTTPCCNVPESMNPLQKVQQAKVLLNEACEESDNDDVCERIEELNDEVDGVIADLEAIYSPEAAKAAREAEEARIAQEQADAEEAQRLADEAAEMMKGF